MPVLHLSICCVLIVWKYPYFCFRKFSFIKNLYPKGIFNCSTMVVSPPMVFYLQQSFTAIKNAYPNLTWVQFCADLIFWVLKLWKNPWNLAYAKFYQREVQSYITENNLNHWTLMRIKLWSGKISFNRPCLECSISGYRLWYNFPALNPFTPNGVFRGTAKFSEEIINKTFWHNLMLIFC